MLIMKAVEEMIILPRHFCVAFISLTTSGKVRYNIFDEMFEQ